MWWIITQNIIMRTTNSKIRALILFCLIFEIAFAQSLRKSTRLTSKKPKSTDNINESDCSQCFNNGQSSARSKEPVVALLLSINPFTSDSSRQPSVIGNPPIPIIDNSNLNGKELIADLMEKGFVKSSQPEKSSPSPPINSDKDQQQEYERVLNILNSIIQRNVNAQPTLALSTAKGPDKLPSQNTVLDKSPTLPTTANDSQEEADSEETSKSAEHNDSYVSDEKMNESHSDEIQSDSNESTKDPRKVLKIKFNIAKMIEKELEKLHDLECECQQNEESDEADSVSAEPEDDGHNDSPQGLLKKQNNLSTRRRRLIQMPDEMDSIVENPEIEFSHFSAKKNFRKHDTSIRSKRDQNNTKKTHRRSWRTISKKSSSKRSSSSASSNNAENRSHNKQPNLIKKVNFRILNWDEVRHFLEIYKAQLGAEIKTNRNVIPPKQNNSKNKNRLPRIKLFEF